MAANGSTAVPQQLSSLHRNSSVVICIIVCTVLYFLYFIVYIIDDDVTDKIVSVQVDDEESMIQFIDISGSEASHHL